MIHHPSRAGALPALLLLTATLAAAGCTSEGGDDGFVLDSCDANPACFPDAQIDVFVPAPRPEDGQPPLPDAASDAAPDSGADSGPDSGPDSGADSGPDSGPDAGPDSGTDATPGPIETCEAIGSVECFGHPDCPDAQRCEDVGPPGTPVPCCVPGPRGDLPPGASCAGVDGQIACASGVCIEDVMGDDLCSGPCAAPADCPPTLPRCVAFPFGGTAFDWCFPE